MAKTAKKSAKSEAAAGQSKKPVFRNKSDLRTQYVADEKYTGREPQWDTERAQTMTQQEYDFHLRKSFSYYNYHFSQKDLKKSVVKYMQENNYNKDDVSAFIRSGDRSVPMTLCSLVRAHHVGMPLRERETAYIKEQLRSAIAGAEPATQEEIKTPVQVITIQDRLNERVREVIGELEGYYDDMDKIKFYDFLTRENVPQAQLAKIERVYQDRRAELELAESGTDPQLTEAFAHLRRAGFKQRYAWIDALLSDIEQYRGVKRATKKVRARRPVSADKLVSKLKYAKDYKELKLVSINPSDIIGAQSLWIYDTKTRKLINYIADGLHGPLGVKGTSLTGYDEERSVSKTLRKPEEQLKAFAKAGKVELRKFLSTIKAVESRATGRINENQVLLKIG
jgi:hypothetical protein